MNQLVPADQTSTKEISILSGAAGSSIAPQNLGEVVRFAEVMCRADIALPQHLRGNAGACMAVALQALEWQMSPFAVASKSYAVSGRIAYEAQLIAAVVNTRSGIKGRLKYEYIGTGNEMTCRVTGMLDGEECEYESPPVAAINPKNSPLWKTDPRQQLGYFSARSWARRHCPEVILGVYDRDEVEHFGPGDAKDVTPPVMQRLKDAQKSPAAASGAQEGFDRSFVASETSALSGGAGNGQEIKTEVEPITVINSDGDKIEAVQEIEPAAADHEAGADQPEAEAEPTAVSVPADRRKECIDKMLTYAVDAIAGGFAPKDVANDLGQTAEDFLASLGDEHKQFIGDVLTTAKKVFKGEQTEAAARTFLEGLLGNPVPAVKMEMR